MFLVDRASRTSRLVTGFSSSDTWVSREKFLSTSRSASSAKLFEVRIKVVRFGRELARVGCMLLTRFRASRRVCNRGLSGKFDSAVMSLSVKSIASWSYIPAQPLLSRYESIRMIGRTNLRNAQVLNGGYFVACDSRS